MKLLIKNRYGVTPDELLNNPKISFRAKGLFGYLQSKPDGWSFAIERIINQTTEGKDSIRKAIKELENNGYLIRRPVRDNNGKWSGYDYILYDSPSAVKPTTVKPTTETPDTLSKKEVSNIDIVKKKKIIDKQSEKQKLKGKEATELTQYFYKVLAPDIPYKMINWLREVKAMKLLLKRIDAREIKAYIDKIKEFNKTRFWCIKCNSPTLMNSNLQHIYKEIKSK